MRFRTMARRGAISAFLLFHLSALAIWNMPACEVRSRCQGALSYYMLPTGLWQYWGMFAPDPMTQTVIAEAMARDAQGKIHRYAFPKLADYSSLGRIPRFRYSKFTCNLKESAMPEHRELAVRHAIRQMNLTENEFPLHVELNYLLWQAPPPGSPPVDPMTPPTQQLIAAYKYDSLAEVRQ